MNPDIQSVSLFLLRAKENKIKEKKKWLTVFQVSVQQGSNKSHPPPGSPHILSHTVINTRINWFSEINSWILLVCVCRYERASEVHSNCTLNIYWQSTHWICFSIFLLFLQVSLSSSFFSLRSCFPSSVPSKWPLTSACIKIIEWLTELSLQEKNTLLTRLQKELITQKMLLNTTFIYKW